MSTELSRAVLEVERHVAAGGWDQPLRLYAIVETVGMLRREPELAARLGIHRAEPGELTPVEQEDASDTEPLDTLLARIAWPPEVLGCAVVVERLMLPPDAEAELPTGGDEKTVGEWAAKHPAREDVRIAVGVLRDGSRECAIRLRAHDDDHAVLTGPDLVPGLAEALAATLVD